MSDLPPEFVEFLKNVRGKRSRVVVEHILQHGFITTEDLEETYGYKHPPRAIRDVREQGVALESFSVKNSEGRTIAAYRFNLTTPVQHGKIGGRKVLPKRLKTALMKLSEGKCSICGEHYAQEHLQVDHRIPYEIGGDSQHDSAYMLLCGSCNRAKSWSCEHCQNWRAMKDAGICQTCYWANPDDYQHIAMRQMRRVELIWAEGEIEFYQQLVALAPDKRLSDVLKTILRDYLLKLSRGE